jgi:hypothetical protein
MIKLHQTHNLREQKICRRSTFCMCEGDAARSLSSLIAININWDLLSQKNVIASQKEMRSASNFVPLGSFPLALKGKCVAFDAFSVVECTWREVAVFFLIMTSQYFHQHRRWKAEKNFFFEKRRVCKRDLYCVPTCERKFESTYIHIPLKASHNSSCDKKIALY